MAAIQHYKCILIGDGGVGKTTLVRRRRAGEFERRYHATLGVEVNNLRFSLSNGEQVIFRMWDTAGQEQFGGLRDGYYIQADCAIAVYDRTSKTSYKSLNKWISEFRRICPNVPIVVLGNKTDVPRPIDKQFSYDLPYQHYLYSVKSKFNFDKPFLYLIRELMDPELEIVEHQPTPPLAIPNIPHPPQ